VPTRAALTTCNGLPDHVQRVTRPHTTGSDRSLTESLQRFGVARQLLIEHLVEQFSSAVVLHVLTDRPALHRRDDVRPVLAALDIAGQRRAGAARMARQVAMTRV